MDNRADFPVLIASYPRSGNTLVRTVLFHCFGRKSGSVYSNDFHGNKKLERYVGHIERRSDFGAIPLIKTHNLPDPADQSPVIYVVKDGSAARLRLFLQKAHPNSGNHHRAGSPRSVATCEVV